jgi:hypothetical protein
MVHNKKTHEQFLEDLWVRNKYYREGKFKVVGRYECDICKIDVVDHLNVIMQPTAGSLLRDSAPTIRSAKNKTEYFIAQSRLIHGNFYFYSEVDWISDTDKVIITCPIHGNFEQTPNSHKNGSGCYHCGRVKTIKKQTQKFSEFLLKAKEIHGDKYEYFEEEFTNTSYKTKIRCIKHDHTFYQTPNNHLSGQRCKLCGVESLTQKQRDNNVEPWTHHGWVEKAQRSKYFDSFKVYVIKCWNEEESFYKIGRSFNKIKQRFRSISMPYNYKVIKCIEHEDGLEVCRIEHELLRLNKAHKYTPKIKFGGGNECFSKIIYI